MAGGILGKIVKGGAKLLGGLFKKKGVQAAIQTGAKIAKNPAVQTGLAVAAAEGASALLSGGGGGGATGGWGYRRRARGITARELRGYRKVANLLHKEGMVSRRARGRK